MKSRLLAAVAAVAIAVPGVASAQWYGRVGVGYGTTQSMDLDITPTSPISGFGIQSQGHITPQLAAGYEMGNGFRGELEVGYMYDETGAVGNFINSDSTLQTYTLMANGIYDFDMGSTVSPFLGLGVGALHQRLSAYAPNLANNAPGLLVAAKTMSPAAQLIAGLRLATNSQLSAELRYRFLVTLREAEFDTIFPAGGEVDMTDYASHDVIASLIWSFGAQAAPPPPPPPPPPPAPPPPPPPPPAPAACENVTFVVYFEWDRSDINQQGMDTIRMAAQRAQQCGVANVSIEGHADRSGSASYNVGLSERRANAVREALINSGIAGTAITTQAFGESQPAVDTPDGVREPLNRRSEVVIVVNGAGS